MANAKKGINKIYEIFRSSFDKAELTSPTDGCQNYQMPVLSPPKAEETAKRDTEERVFLRQVCTFLYAGPQRQKQTKEAPAVFHSICASGVSFESRSSFGYFV